MLSMILKIEMCVFLCPQRYGTPLNDSTNMNDNNKDYRCQCYISRLQTKLQKGNVFTPVCHSVHRGVMHGRGRAWQREACVAGGACMAEDVHDRGCVWQGGPCVAGRGAWQGGWGHAWQGGMCGGHAWQGGVHGRGWGHVWQGACMTGWGRHAWQARWPLLWTVRILLECILVCQNFRTLS